MGEYLTGAAQPAAPDPSPTERLAQIEQLHADGVLTDEEYVEKRRQIIEEL